MPEDASSWELLRGKPAEERRDFHLLYSDHRGRACLRMLDEGVDNTTAQLPAARLVTWKTT